MTYQHRFTFSFPPLLTRARSTFALIVVALLSVVTVPVHADVFHLPITARMEASTTWAENLSRTSAVPNRVNTLKQETNFTATVLTPIATGFSLITELAAGYELVPRYARTNALNAGPRALLRYKFGLGAYTPVLSAEGAFIRREARLPGDNGWVASGALRLSQRFTESWRASLTGDWSQHYAAHSAFDVRSHRLLGTVTYDLNSVWQLTYGRGRLWGDFTANAAGTVWAKAVGGQLGTAIQNYYSSVSSETNNSYGSGWVSYRVTGHSDFWWLELSPALGRNTSLPLRYESSTTINRVGIEYPQHLWTAGILHRF